MGNNKPPPFYFAAANPNPIQLRRRGSLQSPATMNKGLISVDQWTHNSSQAYFLTHLHSDHTKGLSSSWAKGLLFCSPLTAKLFPFKFKDFDLSLIRILETGSWHTLSLVSPSTGSHTNIQVMAIDADHCPGAVMFLFCGDFGCLLYTGDFRWEATSDRAKMGMDLICDAIKDHVVDILYLDNTYCNPSYDFPCREVAAHQIVDIIVAHPEHDIIIGIDTLGKEDLLVYISRVLNIKIWVSPERLQTMHLLGFHDIFTTNTSLTRVRAVPRYSFNIDTLEELNRMRPTMGIMPSGLPWMVRPMFGSLSRVRFNNSKCSAHTGIETANPNGQNIRVEEKLHDYMYSVPYSDHSSYPELENFIKLVQPTTLKGIVTSSSSYIEPLYYFGHLCRVNGSAQSLHHKNKRKKEEFQKLGTIRTKSSRELQDDIRVKKRKDY